MFSKSFLLALFLHISFTCNAFANSLDKEFFFDDGFLQDYFEKNELLWGNSKDKGKKGNFNPSDIAQLEKKILQKIFGQPLAVKLTVDALARYCVGLQEPNKPIACLLFIGPTGVGKTQLAKVLAKELFGEENNLIRQDMSEFAHSESITRLIGSPPGYIDSDSGGQLTNAIREKKSAVVLLDEIDKAHPVVLKTFLHAFDEGYMTDARGRLVDCSQIIFILTTNITSNEILELSSLNYPIHDILDSIQSEIISYLSPELYNRLDPVIFTGLSSAAFDRLITFLLDEVKDMLKKSKKINLSFDETVIAYLRKDGFNYELGARPLKRLINREIITAIAYDLMQGKHKTGDSICVFYENSEIILKTKK